MSTTRFYKTEEHGVVFRLELPEQRTVSEHGFRDEDVFWPVSVRLYLESGDKSHAYESLRNALKLLDVLFKHQVTDERVLRVILQASGHQPREDRKTPTPDNVAAQGGSPSGDGKAHAD